MIQNQWREHLRPDVVVTTIGAAIVVGATLSGGASAMSPCSAGDVPQLATVVAVLDGETIQLDDGRVVRLAGIEAPKRPLQAPEEEPWPLSAVAKQGLGRMVVGQTVGIVLVTDRPDRHGRWRANVFVGAANEWVQGLAVAAGWARVHWLPPDSACIFALLDQERIARAANLGLWMNAEYRVRDAGEPSLAGLNGLYELVQGRVRSVGHGSYMVFLDFGGDYRRDFTVMVSPPVAQRLAQAGLPVDGFKGRRIRVRGVIEASGGPAIRLNDPGEIEVLDDGDD